MMNRYSRWQEAVPLPDQTVGSVAAVFYSTWISRFGVPHTVTTDHGRQFEFKFKQIKWAVKKAA